MILCNCNFIKASDIFSHSVVNSKLRKHGLGVEWAENWLDYCTERVVIHITTNQLTNYQRVRNENTSGVDSGTPATQFCSDLGDRTEQNAPSANL